MEEKKLDYDYLKVKKEICEDNDIDIKIKKNISLCENKISKIQLILIYD